jgi:two-component system phosphate regulon response regulator PhoB
MPCGTIVVIDADPKTAEQRREALAQAGYDVSDAPTARSGLALVARQKPDLVLLSLALPDLNGFEVCRRLQQEPGLRNIPIIITSRTRGESDEVLGLGIGADDFLSEPFSPRVLLARIEAVLRRVRSRRGMPGRIRRDGLCLDADRHEVRVNGEVVPFTATEFRLFHCLAARPGQVLSRRQLIHHAIEEQVAERTVDVHVGAIRRKLGSYGRLVETVRGVGYRFKDLL